jgi:hypothetical protein
MMVDFPEGLQRIGKTLIVLQAPNRFRRTFEKLIDGSVDTPAISRSEAQNKICEQMMELNVPATPIGIGLCPQTFDIILMWDMPADIDYRQFEKRDKKFPD